MHTKAIAAVAAIIASLVIALAPAGRADEASPTLARYDQSVDESIDKALAFLARQQQADGSFLSPMKGDTAITSLSVMAFLAKGYTPGTGPYGQTLNKGIDAILAAQRPDGMLVGNSHGPWYSHCIATLLLSEISGMVDAERQKKVDAALAKALKLILTAQQVVKPAPMQGGWRYQPSSPDSDISCTGWALMALRSTRNAGADVPRQAIDQAVKFVMNCRMPDGGFGYQPGGGSGLARTGTALLCLELCGLHQDKACVGAGDWILKNLPTNFGDGFFYYGLYYSSQGMFQLGGDYWEKFAAHMYEMMLKYQQKDGSWPQGAGNESTAGTCYSTAMAVLAMSVSYRQLPIYQR